MRRIRLAAAVVVGVAAAFAATAGSAGAGLLSCPGPYSQTFAQWGDPSPYTLVPGGSFEGTTGWRLSGGAAVVSGNEPFYVRSSSDSHSLLLPPGSSATSPATCFATLDPAMRLVGKASDGSGVRVDLYTATLFGIVRLPISTTVDLSSDWNASEKQNVFLNQVLALTSLGTTNVILRFTPVGSATVQLDDVQIDPLFQW